MSNESKPGELTELLLRWEELQAKGLHVSAEEHCRDSPELLSAFLEEIDRLKRIPPISASATPAGAGADPSSLGMERLTLETRLSRFRPLAKGGMGEVWLAAR